MAHPNALQGHHTGPETMPDTGRFLTDEEYRFIQNNIVIGCTDVLIIDPTTNEALSGYRQQKPQEGYWFSCGGRMKRGQSYQEAGASKIKAELGMEIDPDRLEFLTAYSTAFDERAQQPREEGVHTSNAVVTLFVTPEERGQMAISLNEEHEKADWVPLEDIAQDDETFPVVLRDAIGKVEDSLCLEFALQTRDFETSAHQLKERRREVVDMPRTSFEVPEDHVFFVADTRSQYYNEDPFQTALYSTRAGGVVEAATLERAISGPGYEKRQGALLAEGESVTMETYLLGYPVTTKVQNIEGTAQLIEACELPQEVVDDANLLELAISDPYKGGLYGRKHYTKRFITEQRIKRGLIAGKDHSGERTPIAATYQGEKEAGGHRYTGPISPYYDDLRRQHAKNLADPSY